MSRTLIRVILHAPFKFLLHPTIEVKFPNCHSVKTQIHHPSSHTIHCWTPPSLLHHDCLPSDDLHHFVVAQSHSTNHLLFPPFIATNHLLSHLASCCHHEYIVSCVCLCFCFTALNIYILTIRSVWYMRNGNPYDHTD